MRAGRARRDLQALGDYPAELAVLGDAPAALFCSGSGDLGVLTREPVVAVVGTRQPSAYGLEVATQLGRDLGVAGITVASGLALGIDAAAHRGCVDAGGRALAVLAGGADVPYPRTNLGLYRRIRARRGRRLGAAARPAATALGLSRHVTGSWRGWRR